jgi:GAF domain-containing protein
MSHLPLGLGLKAAWSLPILSSSGEVLGTFGTYFGEVRAPSVQERQLVEVVARTAALAIERHATDAARQESARRDRFLADLAAQTQPLTEPQEVMAISARLLAEHLDVDRCAYARVEDERVFVVPHDFNRNVPSIVGRWDVAAFGRGCVQAMAAGQPFVVSDSENDPRIAPEFVEAYRATRIRAGVCVPLHKQGVFTAAMAVHQSKPRVFSAAEIDLVAYDGDTLCFIEVKTRASDWFAPPQVNVDLRKRRQITRAARVYRQMLGIEDEPHRYDVVTVVIGDTATPQLELLRSFWSEKNLRHGYTE